jgi:hypothetical protein
MSNHLIIGLGGTGGKIIRAFRKTIFQEFRQTEPEDVNIGYLYVDSDNGMMAPDDPSWKIMGRLVQLGKNQQVCIQGANLQEHLDNINAFPGIKPWIGDQNQWNDILRAFVGVAILGGQKRRLGRFLFACNVDKFVNQLTLQVAELQRKSKKNDVTFHVCCGLAGGTGSGIIVDVLAQIRQHYPCGDEDKTFRLIAYTLLPERNPKPGWNTGNYHANGYAALLELNALSAGAFVPYDISSGGRINRNSVMFNGLYLFTNQNEQGNILDVEDEVPDMMADFLYQKIVAIRNLSWNGLRRAENMENGNPTPETAPIPGSKIPERAKRFLTFGIKRVAIPEEEIKEYLSYHFARQVALHLKFNNWDDTHGFIEQAHNQDFYSFVTEKATQINWLLSDEHLCLSKAILPQDINKNWHTIEEDWRRVVPNFTSVVREKPKKTWLEELEKFFERRFDTLFRSGGRGEVGGVKKFYALKQRAITQMAKVIRQKIEDELFADWNNGVRSIHEIVALVSALIESVDERHKEVSAKVTQREKEVEYAEDHIAKVNQKWATAWLSKLFKANNMLDEQALNLCNLYIAQTWLEALLFSEKLMEVLLEELRNFQTDLVKGMNIVTKAVEEFDKMLAQRIEDETKTDVTKQVVRFYDPNLVKTVTNQLISNENVQRSCATNVRLEVVKKMGTNPNFSAFAQLDISTFIDTLVIQSEQNAQREHDRHTESTKRLVGVSIIEKLKGEYESDPQALQLYVNDLVEHASNYLSFSTAEVHKQSPGIPPDSPTRFSLFTVILPQAPEYKTFVEKLEQAFQNACTLEVKFLYSDSKLNEIAMVNITNLFPLRFVEVVGFLQQKYLARLDSADDPARGMLEIYTEDREFPSLFVPSTSDMEKEAIPYLLLAKVMDLIVLLENPRTGIKQFAFMQHENVEDFPPVYLGEIFVKSFEALGDLTHLETVKQRVTELLNTTEYRHQQKREELVEAMRLEVRRIREEECENDLESPVYQRFNEGRKAAIEILNKG